jgi:hypothetical protein
MKKREKLPEVEEFERTFDRLAQSNPSSNLRSSGQPSPLPSRSLGKTPVPSQALRASAASSGLWSASPGQPVRRATGPGRVQTWQPDDQDDGVEKDHQGQGKTSPPRSAARNRSATILARLALIIVALLAAYSLQSHSRHQYFPGTINGATVSNISYDAGWPLVYAHVEAQQAPLSDVDPTPAFHYISPAKLALDVLLLAVPFWVLLEAVWLFWVFILERFGPRRFVRRFFAVGFTLLAAALWLLGAIGLGVFIGFSGGQLSALPQFAVLALLPAVPGFGLASATSVLLGISPNLWHLDFGVFLLVLALPLALLTACLYVIFCLLGRGLRKLLKHSDA